MVPVRNPVKINKSASLISKTFEIKPSQVPGYSTYNSKKTDQERCRTGMRGIVLAMLVFQTERPGFKSCSKLHSRVLMNRWTLIKDTYS